MAFPSRPLIWHRRKKSAGLTGAESGVLGGFKLLGRSMPQAAGDRQALLQSINILFIIGGMIQTFANTETEAFFASGKSRRLPSEILKRAMMRLTQLDAAVQVEDLRMPPSNQLEKLSGDRAGQWSIRINGQWRVCFRFEGGDAFAVEIVDYH